MNDPNANQNQNPNHHHPPPPVPIQFPIQGGGLFANGFNQQFPFANGFNQPVPIWVQQLLVNQQTLLLRQQAIIQRLLDELNSENNDES
jgi:hypothetical protein